LRPKVKCSHTPRKLRPTNFPGRWDATGTTGATLRTQSSSRACGLPAARRRRRESCTRVRGTRRVRSRAAPDPSQALSKRHQGSAPTRRSDRPDLNRDGDAHRCACTTSNHPIGCRPGARFVAEAVTGRPAAWRRMQSSVEARLPARWRPLWAGSMWLLHAFTGHRGSAFALVCDE
jgi:hypothetical protein